MQLYPHLSFDGRCEEAFKFYETCLGGKISFMMPWGETPMAGEFPAEFHSKIAHGTFAMGAAAFSGSDAPPGGYLKPQGFALQMNLADVAEAVRIFSALSEGGTVQMPLQETFWAGRYGIVVDRFGIPWEINCEKQ